MRGGFIWASLADCFPILISMISTWTGSCSRFRISRPDPLADELIVRDAQDNELYRIKWDGDGFTLTQAGGTPLTYRISNGTLTAPTINSTALRSGAATITGNMLCGTATVNGAVTCGTIVPSTPVDISHGGTGATNAATARANLGAMAADAVIPIAQGCRTHRAGWRACQSDG